MNRPAVFQIAAETHGKVVQTTELALQRKQVGESLGGVEVSAVARVDDVTVRDKRSRLCRALLRVAHYKDIGVGADNLDCVFKVFSLGNGGVARVVKADNIAAQTYHCRLKAHLRACRRLVEQCRHYFPFAFFGVFRRVCLDFLCEVDYLVPLRNGIIVHIHQIVKIFQKNHLCYNNYNRNVPQLQDI